jgi:glycolate oxidase iron-sulfur subunit
MTAMDDVIHTPVSADKNLGRLLTDLGERSVYDAASQCSRCGYCEQSCPTYKATGEEKKSPRGRNQLVRLLLEGKPVDKAAAAEAFDTCLLCSACSTTCYAHVPTADIVLEGRRLLREKAPWLSRALCALLLERPRLFERLLKLANIAKRLGLSKLARPALRWAGLPGLAIADEHVSLAPHAFSHERLNSGGAKSGAYLQFMPCGTRYLFTDVALATEKALSKRGGSQPLQSGCCGLLAYNYGEVADARKFAEKVIEAAERDEKPVVVDCSSCAAFLKSYEQLFLGDQSWRDRAKAFAARVLDAAEIFADVPAPRAARYHESCRACHGQNLKAPATFATLDASRDCCGGAGAFSFLQPELSDDLLRRKIEKIARARATLVVTSSTSCLIQLAHGLSNYYPSCAVKHISEIAAFSDGEATS